MLNDANAVNSTVATFACNINAVVKPSFAQNSLAEEPFKLRRGVQMESADRMKLFAPRFVKD